MEEEALSVHDTTEKLNCHFLKRSLLYGFYHGRLRQKGLAVIMTVMIILMSKILVILITDNSFHGRRITYKNLDCFLFIASK